MIVPFVLWRKQFAHEGAVLWDILGCKDVGGEPCCGFVLEW
jgi:hypothetical protein